MPPTSRNRTRATGLVSGSGTFSGTPIGPWSYNTMYETMDDTIGDYMGVHPLYKRTTTWSGSIIRKLTGTLILNDVPSRAYDNVPDIPAQFPSLSSYNNRMLAQTGPLTPRVYLPLFMFELKDLPKMLRHAGNLLHKIRSPSGLNPAKEAAAATLAYQFGWGPLLQDLGRMLDFADAVKRRQEILRKAHTDKGISRRVTLDNLHRSGQSSTNVWSTYGMNLSQTFDYAATMVVWGTVRWKVRDPNQIGKSPSFKEAFDTAYGLNAGHIPIMIWKALPWSWMIDWFAGISDLMQANYNMIYYKPTRLCIMGKVVNTWKLKEKAIGASPGDHVSEGTITSTYLRRHAVGTPSTNFNLKLPFLDNFKLSILGSLTILRLSGGR